MVDVVIISLVGGWKDGSGVEVGTDGPDICPNSREGEKERRKGD